MKNIAIIGGGVSGTASFIELVKSFKNNMPLDGVTISIFNPTLEIGTGLPYSSQTKECFLLNHEMDDMGGINVAGEVEKDDFYQWVQTHSAQLQPQYPEFNLGDRNEYIPRKIYGQYIKERYEEAKGQAARLGIHVQEVVGEVTQVAKQHAFVGLHYNAGGEKHRQLYDKVVLALGHHYKPGSAQFTNTGKYFRGNQINEILDSGTVRDKNVVIQGTGQYADELALSMLDAGARHVTMASRHGLLHAVRCGHKPYQRHHLTIANLEALSGGADKPFRLADVVRLLKQDIEEAVTHSVDWQQVVAPQNVLYHLKQQIAGAESGQEQKWRSALLSLKDIRQEIYSRLAPEDKKDFVQNHRSVFFAYQAPIPLKVARKLEKALEEGKLEVLGGWQTSTWDDASQQFKVTCAPHHPGHDPLQPVADTALRKVDADILVSASGQTPNATDIPLLKTMLAQQEAVEDPCGGVMVNMKNYHLQTPDGESPDVYALGPIISGQQLLSSNAAVFMQSAKVIAASITQELAQGMSRSLTAYRAHER